MLRITYVQFLDEFTCRLESGFMTNNKNKIMQSLIEENEKLRKRITQMERELEITNNNHVELLHDVMRCKIMIREVLDGVKDDSMYRNKDERSSLD